jgi:hypothetical protein
VSTEIEKNQDVVLQYLYQRGLEARTEKISPFVDGEAIREATNLNPVQINDAIELLDDSGLVERHTALDTEPYTFYAVEITARGKYEVQRRKSIKEAIPSVETISRVSDRSDIVALLERYKTAILKVKPPVPIGSPYGFTPIDWELVSRRKKKKDVLYVVLGGKFKSSHYDTTELRKNVRNMFDLAVQRYNKENPGESISLEFVALHAGYGEHLFNAIARDIISSDIAIFETSDPVPNVFIEVGVALTWGSRVFLIKEQGCSPQMSDISGHTHADYLDNAATFEDPEHEEKLYTMVEHAIRKKA